MSKKPTNPALAAAKRAQKSLKKNRPRALDAEPKPADDRSHSQIKYDIAKNRQALTETLDAIEFKLNVPKQARAAVQGVKEKITVLREENPAVLVGGAAAAVAVAGTVVWLGVRAVTKR